MEHDREIMSLNMFVPSIKITTWMGGIIWTCSIASGTVSISLKYEVNMKSHVAALEKEICENKEKVNQGV